MPFKLIDLFNEDIGKTDLAIPTAEFGEGDLSVTLVPSEKEVLLIISVLDTKHNLGDPLNLTDINSTPKFALSFSKEESLDRIIDYLQAAKKRLKGTQLVDALEEVLNDR